MGKIWLITINPQRLYVEYDERKVITLGRPPKTICDICGKKFENGNQLRAHKSSHSKKEFVCDICGEKVIGATQYKAHKMNHRNHDINNEECECEVCGKKFHSKMSLYGHMQQHVGKKRKIYTCKHCDQDFKKSDYINHIIRVIDKSDEYRIKFKGHVLKENIKYVKCKICGIDKFNLTEHLKNEHNMTIEEYINKYQSPIKIENLSKLNDRIDFEINEKPIYPKKNQNLLLARGIMNYKEEFINLLSPNNVVFSDTKYYVSKVINGKKVVKNPDFIVINPEYLNEVLDDINKNNKVSLKNYKYIIGVIEHFGCYWHGPKVTGISNEQHEKNTIDYYNMCGKNCLIIWENEVNENNKKNLENKINNFIYNCLKS